MSRKHPTRSLEKRTKGRALGTHDEETLAGGKGGSGHAAAVAAVAWTVAGGSEGWGGVRERGMDSV